MTRFTALVVLALAAACGHKAQPGAQATVSARATADMIHAVIAADRHAYTKQVVNRLTVAHEVTVVDPVHDTRARFAASESWRNDHASLPLPAQMLRLGAAQVAKARAGVTYTLLSSWPINDQNRPQTEVEKTALARLEKAPEPVYMRETLGDGHFLTAVYPDVAVVEACVRCHNHHPESPRTDFAVGDVMGALVIRIPID
ncbi:MAG TPA: DUF3365 domain-containing protein [Kofleriaceae bacterium]|nr:DUF3365 domain-containing protein [Kofleriaceae bacterium]